LVATGVGVSAGLAGEADNGIGVLSGNDYLLPMARDKLADKLLTGAVGVDVGRVDEIAARLAISVVDFSGLVFGCAPTPIITEGHGAKTEIRDAEAAAAEKLVVHLDSQFLGFGLEKGL
jgi:hypothetical protein